MLSSYGRLRFLLLDLATALLTFDIWFERFRDNFNSHSDSEGT